MGSTGGYPVCSVPAIMSPVTNEVVLSLTNYGLKGDFEDWEIFGRYIGINVHPELPEFDLKIIVFIMLGLSLVTIGAAFRGARMRKIVCPKRPPNTPALQH